MRLPLIGKSVLHPQATLHRQPGNIIISQTLGQLLMGTFYTKCKIENAVDRERSAVVSRILVDTGSEYTWVPATTLEKIGIDREKKDVAFVMANGQQITRSVGFAIIRLDKHFTVDEVLFAEKGDLLLLGARSLEGLNLTVDARRKKLIAAGPLPAA
jgi:predicted aspartyl protease